MGGSPTGCGGQQGTWSTVTSSPPSEPPMRSLLRAAALAFTLFLGASAVLPAGEPPPPRTPESSTTPNNRNQKRHDGFMARIKQGPVGLLFLGDSITDGWPGR